MNEVIKLHELAEEENKLYRQLSGLRNTKKEGLGPELTNEVLGFYRVFKSLTGSSSQPSSLGASLSDKRELLKKALPLISELVEIVSSPAFLPLAVDLNWAVAANQGDKGIDSLGLYELLPRLLTIRQASEQLTKEVAGKKSLELNDAMVSIGSIIAKRFRAYGLDCTHRPSNLFYKTIELLFQPSLENASHENCRASSGLRSIIDRAIASAKPVKMQA